MENSKEKGNPKWTSRITTLEKLLMIAITILVILVIITIALLIYFSLRTSENEVCASRGCLKAANEVLQRIDPTINPCDDFYQFACGGFEKSSLYPDHVGKLGTAEILTEMVQEQLKLLFEKPANDSEIRPFSLLKSVYQMCMDEEEFEAEGMSYAKRLLKTELGGWPVVEGSNWNSFGFNWEMLSYKLIEKGFDIDLFFRLDVIPYSKNQSRNFLHLGQPYISDFQSELKNGFNETVVQAYYDYMVKVAVIFGADERRALKEMKELVDLLIDLSRISLGSAETYDATLNANPITIFDLQETYPYVNWLNYINHLIHPQPQRSYNDSVILVSPSYFQNLRKVLDEVPQRTIANYMCWEVVSVEVMSLINQDLKNAHSEFLKVKSGNFEQSPRWKECVDTASKMKIASDSMYVRNYLKPDAKLKLEELGENVRNKFIDMVQHVSWMNETAKVQIVDKSKNLYFMFGYPDEFMDNKEVEDYYQNLTISTGNSLEALLNITRFSNQMEYSNLDELNDNHDWRRLIPSTRTTGFYDDNVGQFPAGLLQWVFFDNDRPQYMNYGGIGFYAGIGAIIHSFDYKGPQYAKGDNFMEKKETKKVFDQCKTVIKENSKLNDTNHCGPQIVSYGGNKIAYLAYKKWVKEHHSEKGLPGLTYSPEQLFWISIGNTLCKIDAFSDESSLEHHLVNTAFMNLEYFANDFNCPLGSNMNPENKCNVW